MTGHRTQSDQSLPCDHTNDAHVLSHIDYVYGPDMPLDT
jgi:hypothetical protein